MMGPAGAAKLSIASDDVRTKAVITAEHVTKSFGDRTIIKDFSLRVRRGDRIGIVGSNGAGKTTLLKLLTGELAPDSGTVNLAKTLDGVIIDQQRSLMAPDKSVRDVLTNGGDWIEVQGVKKHLIGYLKDFLFDPGVADAPIGSLSGGERSRLLLAREFARESNLLVLDEPTNDLDLETLDLLQEVISGLRGHRADRQPRPRFPRPHRHRHARPRRLGKRSISSLAAMPTGKRAAPPRPRRARLARNPWQSPQRHRQSSPTATSVTMTCCPRASRRWTAAIARDEALLMDADLYTRDRARFDALNAAIAAARAEKDAAEERWLMLAEAVDALA